jgi:hypothetical protein
VIITSASRGSARVFAPPVDAIHGSAGIVRRPRDKALRAVVWTRDDGGRVICSA